MSFTNGNGHKPKPKNVLGGEVKSCCTDPMTGFYRDGFCKTGIDDVGSHTVCIEATDEFLEFSKSRGNDLTTPRPEYNFPGVKDGDKWCLCATRWRDALEAGVAPKVILEACHEASLRYVTLEDLKKHAF
ncbi:DUF2237 domain-containing protein [soil metagenome]